MSDDGSECLTFDDRGARPGYRNEVLVALLVTAGLGVALRFVLAGNLTLPWNFAHLRHAHSHAGVYALLFPLCFMAWKQMGVVTLGRMVYAFYFAASAVAVVIFIRSGYVFLSIAGSTIVGGIWLLAAYRARSILRGESGAFRVMPLALLGATLFVPPIAIATPREPEFAQALAHTFLAFLFLLVMVPTALRRIGIARLDARIFVPSAALAAFHLGVMPSGAGALASVVLGLQVAITGGRATASLALRCAWVGFGMGTVVVGAMPELPHGVLVGGLHYLLLGPLFLSLAQPAAKWSWLGLSAAASMGAALGPLAPALSGPLVHQLAAVAGVLWLIAALGALLKNPHL